MNNKEEFRKRLEKEIEKDEKLESEFRQKAIDLSVINLQEIRKLVAQISVLSATIIGILIALGRDSDLIKNQAFLMCALFVLIFVISYALIYLKRKLEKENKDLPEINTFYLESIAKGRHIREELLDRIILGEDDREAYTKYNTDVEEVRNGFLRKSPIQSKTGNLDYGLDVLAGSLIFALVLIALSVIDFQWIVSLFCRK